MDFVKTSKLCEGFVESPQSTASSSSIPHAKGSFKVLSVGYENIERRMIAKECQIFCPSFFGANMCNNCLNLSRQQEKKENRGNNTSMISLTTNHRYLTKDQLICKLKTEINTRKCAETREHYWKRKFEMQQIDMDGKDNNDLETIFNSVDSDNVPPDMKYIWEQQLRINHCKYKKAYRWHPK